MLSIIKAKIILHEPDNKELTLYKYVMPTLILFNIKNILMSILNISIMCVLFHLKSK